MNANRPETRDAFLKAYSELNTEQKKAVDTIDGPVLVVAGPGSGKTQILSLRVANILLNTDTRPSNILCLTFTDSAAAAMRERLVKFIGHEAYKVCINTFHSFSTDIIGTHPEYFYNGSSFAPADTLTQLEILEQLFLSLPHDNPLRTERPEDGFIYLDAVLKAIGELKKAGITPEEFQKILDHNSKDLKTIHASLTHLLTERVSMKIVPSLLEVAHELKNHRNSAFPLPQFESLSIVVAQSLMRAANTAAEEERAAPITAWKQRFMRKDDDGNQVLKDALYIEKMKALGHLYAEYTKTMRAAGYFDFNDMILDVIKALEVKKTLRSEVQERYQYILVDEFQDTNDAQLRLLGLIANAPVNEGKPNIMAVGDDDQAVYKFQGADVSNMLNFGKMFGEPVRVVLRDNYRSTQDILDIARHLIVQGDERLENAIPELTKELRAASEQKGGEAESKAFPSSIHQYAWVARDVKRRINLGTKPSDIALISRSHKVLEAIAPYLHEHGVPVSYERQQNVFEEPHIRQLIIIARFLSSLSSKRKVEADDLLPEILSFPFWNFDRKIVWNISVEAHAKRKLWLDIMLEHRDLKICSIAHFFLEMAARARYEPVERVLDALIGSHIDFYAADDEDLQIVEKKAQNGFVSPFKQYYFNKNSFTEKRIEYLSFLSSLRVFIESLREYRKGKKLFIDDLVAFVDLRIKHGILVTDQSPFANGLEAVHLLTAHKAKGLEFDTVFVLSCQDDVWASRGRASLLPFPANMQIAPTGDTGDDHLRLFYVAVTRAKRALILTSYEMDEKGRDSGRFGFLATPAPGKVGEALLPQNTSDITPNSHDIILSAWQSYNRPPFAGDEQALLRKCVENYHMSVTHLNNFLDITRGGPLTFLEQNLLQFPQSKSPSGSFGTAMHRVIECIFSHVKQEGKRPTFTKIMSWFEDALTAERMNDDDFILYRSQGEAALRAYYDAKKDSFVATTLSEVNFKNQGVCVGKAHLAGKIDKIVRHDDGTLTVHDFKTGNAVTDWEGHTPYEKVKIYRYKRQLVFYKILVEMSRDYSDSTVARGVLEFLESYRGKILDLELTIEQGDVERLKALIEAVYHKVCNLDFPDTSKYSLDLAGIMAFEDDLLKGN